MENQRDTTYQYAEEFQCKILALCLREPNILKNYQDCINPSYFDYPDLRSICQLTIVYFSRFNVLPSRSTFVEELISFCRTRKIKEEQIDHLVNRVNYLFDVNLDDSEVVLDRIARFAQEQEIKKAIVKGYHLLNNGDSDLSTIKIDIEKALLVGANISDLGSSFFGNIANIPLESMQNGIVDVTKRIKTFLPTLDNATLGGHGPGKGEVWIVMGLPGVGKSQLLVNIGASAIKQDVPTIHVTVGDLDEHDVKVRYAARLLNCTMDDVIYNRENFSIQARKWDSYTEKYLKIKYYPSHTLSCSMLRSYLSKVISIDGVKPGLVIVDYPDEFKSEIKLNDYQNMGYIYSELKKIAADYNVLVWVASQVQRYSARPQKFSGGGDDYLTMDNVADSWRKSQKVDGIISINQKTVEYDCGLTRIWIDKVRRGQKNKMIYTKSDLSRCLYTQIPRDEYDVILERQKSLNKFEDKRRSSIADQFNNEGGDPTGLNVEKIIKRIDEPVYTD